MNSKINFFKTAIKDYKVGAVTPSSAFVVKKIIHKLPRNVRYIVEYGAGDGIITKALLSHLPADGHITAIETNPHFISLLKKIHDPRLRIIKNDVIKISQNLSALKLPRIDAVVSGIPFSFLASAKRHEIVKNTYKKLGFGGCFIIYQVSPLMFPYLKKFLWRDIDVSLEIRNFPPYFIITAEK